MATGVRRTKSVRVKTVMAAFVMRLATAPAVARSPMVMRVRLTTSVSAGTVMRGRSVGRPTGVEGENHRLGLVMTVRRTASARLATVRTAIVWKAVKVRGVIRSPMAMRVRLTTSVSAGTVMRGRSVGRPTGVAVGSRRILPDQNRRARCVRSMPSANQRFAWVENVPIGTAPG